MNAEFDTENDHCKLATENWDGPIVVTTNVQFFESLFGNSVSRIRKLHNISNSVIIFDEAQMITLPYLVPCTKVIDELSRKFNCCCVLCTATQPALSRFFKNVPEEIIRDYESYYEKFKRTKIVGINNINSFTLAERLNKEEQALLIVNQRDLWRTVLSTFLSRLKIYMMARHRNAT